MTIDVLDLAQDLIRRPSVTPADAGAMDVLEGVLAKLGFDCRRMRFGEIENPVGGFGQREALFAAYEAAGGASVDAVRVRFWEVLGTLQWGLMCSGMAEVFRSGADGSVERAMIGRRASEVEIDLLDYLAPLTSEA